MWSDHHNDHRWDQEHPEGELAAFALNALDDAEFQAVFHHVIRCPHCQEVLLGFQDTSARLAAAAPETPLPDRLKRRVLDSAVGRPSPEPASRLATAQDPRWSTRLLRRWMTPAAIAALSVLLAVSIAFMVAQQREIGQLKATVAQSPERDQPVAFAAASVPVASSGAADSANPPSQTAVSASTPPESADGAQAFPIARAAQTLDLERSESRPASPDGSVTQVKQEMSDMVEATVLSGQPETEKLPMKSPMGTETEARGLLMIDPTGMQGVMMVSGMPADSYQIWLVRHDGRVMVDRIVVNDNDGSGVKQLNLGESLFGYQEVALLPDERHGPTLPTGEKFLSARIAPDPPWLPSVWRGR